MPPRSKVAKLPQAVRDELERRIVEYGFGRYEELAEWLQQHGYQIAEDSVQRYGARLRQRIESIDLSVLHAKAIGHAVSGDRDSIIDSTIHLLNGQVFSTLLDAEQIGHDEIFRLARTVCELSKISIARQRWVQEMNSLLNLNPEKRGTRERRGKTPRAEAFAAAARALLAVEAFKPDGASAGPLNRDLSPEADSHARDIGETGPAWPHRRGK